jgi:hypothetical protein
LHAGGFDFGDPRRRLAEMNDLDLVTRGIQRLRDLALGFDADRAQANSNVASTASRPKY